MVDDWRYRKESLDVTDADLHRIASSFDGAVFARASLS
jgi:hypothetical protein